MRLLPVIALAALFGFVPCQDQGCAAVSKGRAATPAGFEAETQPTTPSQKKPEPKMPSIDDEIKALNLKNMELKSAMKQMESLKVEDKLKALSTSTSPDYADARKTGVQLAGMAKMIDWKKNRKRNKDPKAFDQFAGDLEASGRKIAEAAAKKDAADLRAASDAAMKSCNDCHGKFNK